MRILSKLIPADSVHAERWEAPAVNRSGKPGPAMLTAQNIERLQKHAYAEGFALGKREGLVAGQAEMRARAQRLEHLLQALQQPLAQSDDQVERELVQLAFAIARQIVRREIKLDPGQIVAVVREALSLLPMASRTAQLHLHPEDGALVREALALNETEQQWRVVDDPTVSRGGCRVNTETSFIDATLESRVAALAATLLGGERASDGRGAAQNV